MNFEGNLGPRRGERGCRAAAFAAATLPPHPALSRDPPVRRHRSAARPIQFVSASVSQQFLTCGTLPHGQRRVSAARPTPHVSAKPVDPPSGTNHANLAPSGGNRAPPWGTRVISPQRAHDYDADEELNETDGRSLEPLAAPTKRPGLEETPELSEPGVLRQRSKEALAEKARSA